MAYSTLKRKTPLMSKTPLKAKTGFKPSCGFRKKAAEQLPNGDEKKAVKAKERAVKAKRTTKSSLVTHLDIVFSLYIRLRDAMDGGRCRCISCGRTFPFGEIQCGHLFTRHNMSVRWDEENCSAQCQECNCDKSGNLVEYRPNLIRRIGLERFEALCERAHGTRKWSGDELRDMIRHYTEEARRLGREKGVSVRI